MKVLRSSMIELINQDYADFVNLSTNLVGLDHGIDRLREPLEGFHTAIEMANGDIKGSLESVKAKLTRQETIRKDKERLSSLQIVAATLSKVERMVGTEQTTDTAERIATDVNQLHFAVWKMKVNYLHFYYAILFKNVKIYFIPGCSIDQADVTKT